MLKYPKMNISCIENLIVQYTPGDRNQSDNLENTIKNKNCQTKNSKMKKLLKKTKSRKEQINELSDFSQINILHLLFYIFQCSQIFYACTDFYYMPYVIYKVLAIADVTGIETFLGSFDDFFHRDIAADDFYFYLWEECSVYFGATVFFDGTFLDTAAHNLCNGHTGDTPIVHSFSQFVIS